MPHKWRLDNLLKQYCQGPYSKNIEKFSIRFYIDGEISQWGFEGCKKPRLSRQYKMLSIDIGFPLGKWINVSPSAIRTFLAASVESAVDLFATRMKKDHLNFDDRMLTDFQTAKQQFLSEDTDATAVSQEEVTLELRVPAKPETGYKLTYSQDADYGQHQFCGTSEQANAICPNCNKPLLVLVSFDTRDERLDLESFPSPVLELLFCWTCPLSLGFTYRYSEDGNLELMQYDRGPVEEDFPYENYPDTFPAGTCELTALDPRADTLHTLHNHSLDDVVEDLILASDLEEEIDALVPQHQVGGQPVLMQPDMVVRHCPICNEAMPLFATIADDCLDPRGFTDNPYVVTTYNLCRRCNCIAASQQCD